jgi:hypothetical protein
MTAEELVYGCEGNGVPQVALLDASEAGLDADALRRWARRVAAASGAPYTSRSYRYPYALVAWHNQPVGTDIERIGPCDEAFAELICTPVERPTTPGPFGRDIYLTSLWSGKEALAKALGDAVAYEPSRLASPALWPRGRAGTWRAEELRAPPGHVAWLCWRSSGTSPALASPKLERRGALMEPVR